MNHAYKHRNNINKIKACTWPLASLLFVLVMISTILLCEHNLLFTYAKPPDKEIDFQVSDSQKVWDTQTNIELFRVSYENDDRVITAAAGNGQKIIAPGTEQEYIFQLSNIGNVSADYQFTAKAVLSGGLEDYEVPLKVRLSDHTKRYLVGSNNTWADLTQLNTVAENGTLGANHYAAYTLEWQWPFESGNDTFDTMLGNLATDQDLTLTIILQVTAEQNPDPNATGGSPKTNDEQPVWPYVILLILSIAAIASLSIILRHGRKEAQNEEK